jgi:hypothetical protein
MLFWWLVDMIGDDLQSDWHVLEKPKSLSVCCLINQMEIHLLLNESEFYFSKLITCKCDELHEQNLFNHTVPEYYAYNLIKENETIEQRSSHGSSGKRIKYFSRTWMDGLG